MISVIYNGCEFPTNYLEEAGRAERLRLGIAADTIVIGTVSQFAEEKRPQLFIESAVNMLRRDPRLQFVLLGTGPMRQEIQNYVNSHDLSNNIRLPGVTFDVWASLASMNIFVLASRMEGLPNVLIEAQGAGANRDHHGRWSTRNVSGG